MHLQKVLSVFFLTCVLFSFGEANEEHAKFTESVIKKEIERFNTAKDTFLAKDVMMMVQFSSSKVGADGNLLERDSFELRPLTVLKVDGSKPVGPFEYSNLKIIFDLAKKYNISAAASKEMFDKNGILTGKTVYTDFLKISYSDGASDIRIREDPKDIDDDDNEDVEELMNMLKEFELPVEAEKELFDKTGALIKSEKFRYMPKRVAIESSTGMSVDMQMKITEALKRSCSMKDNPIDRIKLLVRYLNIQFPEYSFDAVVGEGSYYVNCEVTIRISFDGEIYNVWGARNEEEE